MRLEYEELVASYNNPSFLPDTLLVGLNFTLFRTASVPFLLFNENIEQGERVMAIVLV